MSDLDLVKTEQIIFAGLQSEFCKPTNKSKLNLKSESEVFKADFTN